MSDTTSELWQFIAEWLEKHRFSQAELAKKSDVAPSTITYLKKKDTTPDLHTLNKLADAMNLPRQLLHELAGIVDEEPPEVEMPRTLVHLWGQLKERDQALVEVIIRNMVDMYQQE